MNIGEFSIDKPHKTPEGQYRAVVFYGDRRYLFDLTADTPEKALQQTLDALEADLKNALLDITMYKHREGIM